MVEILGKNFESILEGFESVKDISEGLRGYFERFGESDPGIG